ncbi:hypothetical protein FAM09_19375 [Niastella caeni]|uniref:Outer membrane protein beta-barrel domain-containing protein n=1 Tax=Niastella caeni TaxID=2569763 RepID=A0A4S8HT10_9BACT|nr:hypothetical protein [Niastella caeni]THU37114.1 hypothetical protein FAM09_19375 [Niastella caeni]
MKYSLMVLAVLLVTGIFSGAHAQKLFFLFAHGQYASPVQSSFKNDYNFGLGAEGGVGIGTGKTFFTGTVGYTVFDARSGEVGNITYVPMKVGLRRYFLPANLLFIHADAGVAHIKDKTTNSTYSRFTADVGAGAKLGPFEVGVAYDGFSRSGSSGYASWLAFKAGWRFGL